MFVLAFLVLGFSMLDALRRLNLVWLHPTPIRPYLDMTIWVASPNAGLPHAYPSLFCSMRCYAYHVCSRHPLAFYASLHGCSHVHAWVLFASVSSMLQHNEVIGIRSKLHLSLMDTTFYLLSCLFAFSLVCLLACLLAFLFLCLPCLSCLSALCLFHMLFASFPSIAFLLVSCLCLCMYTQWARTHGATAWSPKRKQKGGCKHGDISQTAMFSRFRGLASPIWLCTLLNPFPASFLS